MGYYVTTTGVNATIPADLVRIQRSLNGRPRATLGYRMPVEKLAELIALTG